MGVCVVGDWKIAVLILEVIVVTFSIVVTSPWGYFGEFRRRVTKYPGVETINPVVFMSLWYKVSNVVVPYFLVQLTIPHYIPIYLGYIDRIMYYRSHIQLLRISLHQANPYLCHFTQFVLHTCLVLTYQ